MLEGSVDINDENSLEDGTIIRIGYKYIHNIKLRFFPL